MVKSKIYIATAKECLHGLEVAKNSVEGRQHYREQIEPMIPSAIKLSKPHDYLEKSIEISKNMDLESISTAQPWSGQLSEPPGYKNMCKNLVSDMLHTSTEPPFPMPFIMDVAVSSQAELCRGYLFSDGTSFNSKQIELADGLLHAHLADQGLKVTEGVIYEIDRKGDYKKDPKTNEPMKASAEKVGSLRDSIESGLSRNAQSNGLSAKISLKPYPGEALAVEPGRSLG